MKTRSFYAQEANSSSAQQSAMPGLDGRTKRAKRKASPERNSPKKRRRVQKSEPQTASGENLCKRVLKRKVREDDEGPSTKKKGNVRNDTESASSSVCTAIETNSSAAQQNAALGLDGRTKRAKRKASPERNSPKKRRRVQKSEPQTASGDNLCKRVLKRKVREDDEGPSTKKKGNVRNDTESASSSVCTGRETSERKSESKTEMDPKSKFEAKYEQGQNIGQGGCGLVFAGYRKTDNLPVAIKHIPRDKIFCTHEDNNGQKVAAELAIMLKLASEETSSGRTSASVSLLDWYDLDEELILVLERPDPSEDLFQYIRTEGELLDEEQAKIIMQQLVEAVKHLEDNSIFHRDIKPENILIETSSDVPRVRLIDFGLSCFFSKDSSYHNFYGTPAHIPPEWYKTSVYRPGPTTVWQMGVVLFEMLHESFETLKYFRDELNIKFDLSDESLDFLQMCLEEDPEQRPTLEELRHHPWLN